MKRYERNAALAARLALAAIFVYSGFGKLVAPEATAAYIATKSLPAPYLLGVLAGFAELVGGLSLAAGLFTRWAGLGLALFLVPATAFFHNPLGLEGAAANAELIQLYKNLAIAGGLLAVSALGPGAFALANRVRYARQRKADRSAGLRPAALDAAQRS